MTTTNPQDPVNDDVKKARQNLKIRRLAAQERAHSMMLAQKYDLVERVPRGAWIFFDSRGNRVSVAPTEERPTRHPYNREGDWVWCDNGVSRSNA